MNRLTPSRWSLGLCAAGFLAVVALAGVVGVWLSRVIAG